MTDQERVRHLTAALARVRHIAESCARAGGTALTLTDDLLHIVDVVDTETSAAGVNVDAP